MSCCALSLNGSESRKKSAIGACLRGAGAKRRPVSFCFLPKARQGIKKEDLTLTYSSQTPIPEEICWKQKPRSAHAIVFVYFKLEIYSNIPQDVVFVNLTPVLSRRCLRAWSCSTYRSLFVVLAHIESEKPPCAMSCVDYRQLQYTNHI